MRTGIENWDFRNENSSYTCTVVTYMWVFVKGYTVICKKNKTFLACVRLGATS